MENSQKYLDPQTLASLEGLDLQARLVVEGYVAGHASQPVPRLLRRVRRAPRIRARRRHPPRRLESLVEDRQALPQAVRGGDQPAPLPAAGYQRIDGVRLGPERLKLQVRPVRRRPSLAYMVLQQQDSVGLATLRRRRPPLPAAGRPALAPQGTVPRARRHSRAREIGHGRRPPRPGGTVQETRRRGRLLRPLR